jgi:hypothetical protein
MNYYIHIVYFTLKNVYERCSKGCRVCAKEYGELSDYMLEHRIILG